MTETTVCYFHKPHINEHKHFFSVSVLWLSNHFLHVFATSASDPVTAVIVKDEYWFKNGHCFMYI